jgi:hypothetical protein
MCRLGACETIGREPYHEQLPKTLGNITQNSGIRFDQEQEQERLALLDPRKGFYKIKGRHTLGFGSMPSSLGPVHTQASLWFLRVGLQQP